MKMRTEREMGKGGRSKIGGNWEEGGNPKDFIGLPTACAPLWGVFGVRRMRGCGGGGARRLG